MKIVKPKKLQKGDVIGLIAPASFPTNYDKIEKGIVYLEKLGYRVEIGKNVSSEHGYLAGTDEERLDDLHQMFSNKNVKAIFAVRGGYGSGRLLNMIDYNLIKKNPKILVGYSDITALQLALLKKTGLITFAGPMITTDFDSGMCQKAEEFFWQSITSSKKMGKLENPTGERFYVLNKSRAEGQIIGGNLTLLMSLFGTEYLPTLKDAILLLEEIGEAPYRIDRMFNQMKLAKLREEISGLILGRFVDCYERDPEKKSLTLNEVILDYWSELKIPVMYNFVHGHVKNSLTIPLGINCKMNSSKGFIELTESGVE